MYQEDYLAQTGCASAFVPQAFLPGRGRVLDSIIFLLN